MTRFLLRALLLIVLILNLLMLLAGYVLFAGIITIGLIYLFKQQVDLVKGRAENIARGYEQHDNELFNVARSCRPDKNGATIRHEFYVGNDLLFSSPDTSVVETKFDFRTGKKKRRCSAGSPVGL